MDWAARERDIQQNMIPSYDCQFRNCDACPIHPCPYRELNIELLKAKAIQYALDKIYPEKEIRNEPKQ